MTTMLVAGLVGLLNGLLLGLVGGGGSILAVPTLVYLLEQRAGPATTISLIVVGLNSAYGAFRQNQQHSGQVQLDYAVALGLTGLVGAQAGNWLNHSLPEKLLLAGFSLLMLIIASLMLRPRRLRPVEPGLDKPCSLPLPRLREKWFRVGLTGLGLGFLTGLFGVGGGFVIVPALALLLNFPMRLAAGTSLVVIALNSFSALLGRWPLVGLDGSLVVSLLASDFVGVSVGGKLADRLPEKTLRRLFAGLIILVALYMGWRAIFT